MINKYNDNSLHSDFFYHSNIWCKILKKLFKYILKQKNNLKKHLILHYQSHTLLVFLIFLWFHFYPFFFSIIFIKTIIYKEKKPLQMVNLEINKGESISTVHLQSKIVHTFQCFWKHSEHEIEYRAKKSFTKAGK